MTARNWPGCSQTTLSVGQMIETWTVSAPYPNLLDPPSDDICYATRTANGGEEIATAPTWSSWSVRRTRHSVRLVEDALEGRAAAAYRVDDASEIDEDLGWSVSNEWA